MQRSLASCMSGPALRMSLYENSTSCLRAVEVQAKLLAIWQTLIIYSGRILPLQRML